MKRSFKSMAQKGFTLLELLVVITLLAILSVGALVAYEGIGDSAQATAASRNIASTDQAIRNFRAVTQNYPNQFDNLVISGGTDEDGNAVAAVDNEGEAPAVINNDGRGWLASFALGANALEDEIVEAFDRVGVEEVQSRLQLASTPNVSPNLQHNEGAVTEDGGTGVAELELEGLTNIAILPAGLAADCTIGTVGAATYLQTLDDDGALEANGQALTTARAGAILNKINDSIEAGECHMVVAFGFGHDAAHSTSSSSVAISTAPTFISDDINPNTDYARYIALFHVGADADEDGDIETGEIFTRARLLAVTDTEGNMIAETIAEATDEDTTN